MTFNIRLTWRLNLNGRSLSVALLFPDMASRSLASTERLVQLVQEKRHGTVSQYHRRTETARWWVQPIRLDRTPLTGDHGPSFLPYLVQDMLPSLEPSVLACPEILITLRPGTWRSVRLPEAFHCFFSVPLLSLGFPEIYRGYYTSGSLISVDFYLFE